MEIDLCRLGELNFSSIKAKKRRDKYFTFMVIIETTVKKNTGDKFKNSNVFSCLLNCARNIYLRRVEVSKTNFSR